MPDGLDDYAVLKSLFNGFRQGFFPRAVVVRHMAYWQDYNHIRVAKGPCSLWPRRFARSPPSL